MTAAAHLQQPRPAKVLALCYMLPPALFPQAIQIGRLLAHSAHTIGRISGPLGQTSGTQAMEALARPHLVVPDPPTRWPRLYALGLRALPRYGGVPDEYRAWASRAGPAVLA